MSLYVIMTAVVLCYVSGVTVRLTQINEGWALMKPSKVQW